MNIYQNKLRELRQDNDKTQTNIAKILNTTKIYYAKYENGKHPLPIQHLITLCLFYRVQEYMLVLPKGLNWP